VRISMANSNDPPFFLCLHPSADLLCELTVRMMNMWIGNGAFFQPKVFGHLCPVMKKGSVVFLFQWPAPEVRFDNLCTLCWRSVMFNLITFRGYRFVPRDLECRVCFPPLSMGGGGASSGRTASV
jgi:hypothetical protein